MDRAADISVLRARLAGTEVFQEARAPLGHGPADSCLKGGILKGALHEVFPAAPGDEGAASGFALALAARAAEGRRVLWLRTDFSALEHGEVAATGLVELGLDPGRFLILRAPDAASVLRGGLEGLSCAALGAVVLEIPGTPKLLDLTTSRRLVLTAAQSGVTAVLLRLDADAEPSAAETRWFVRAARSERNNESWGAPRFEAELVRHRHGRTGQWVMEWNCDETLFTADAGAVSAVPADRPAEAQRAERVA